MNPEKWEEVKGKIKDAFGGGESLIFEKNNLPEPQKGEMEFAEFTGPMGKMRVEYITKPVLLDKVTHGSRRIGSETAVEYVYSEDEFIHQLKIYKWDDLEDDWGEIDIQKSAFSL